MVWSQLSHSTITTFWLVAILLLHLHKKAQILPIHFLPPPILPQENDENQHHPTHPSKIPPRNGWCHPHQSFHHRLPRDFRSFSCHNFQSKSSCYHFPSHTRPQGKRQAVVVLTWEGCKKDSPPKNPPLSCAKFRYEYIAVYTCNIVTTKRKKCIITRYLANFTEHSILVRLYIRR